MLRFRDSGKWIEFLTGSRKPPEKLGSALLLKVFDQQGNLLAAAGPRLVAAFKGPEFKGHWARLTIPQDAPTINDFFNNLRRKLPANVFENGELVLQSGRYDMPAAVFSEEVRQGQHGDTWAFGLLGRARKKDNAQGQLVRGIPFSSDLLAERIPELNSLREKKVAIIGLGTLGAPVASHLCKAQIGRLAVADADFVDPNTGVRWISELAGAGASKAIAVSQRLAADYPFTEVSAFTLRIGDGSLFKDPLQSESAILETMLAGADLVIDATAEDNVSNAISCLARERGIPHISVFSIDGLGGVVVRLRKDETGCLHCLELACQRGEIVWPEAAANQEATRVQPRGCADPTFIGTSVDLEPLATQAASVAFGALCRGVAGGYPENDPGDVFVLQLRKPDRALTLPSWKAYRLPKDPGCPLCFPK